MPTILTIPQEWRTLWKHGDAFDSLLNMDGQVYREVKGRTTLRFELNSKTYFIKIHLGTTWKEIIKDIVCFKQPVLGAENEWKAIRHLKGLGINTPELVAYGKRGRNLSRIQSFVITRELTGVESLEDVCRHWKVSPLAYRFKCKLITEIARITRILHENGICHRDFYLCHFLLALPDGRDNPDPENICLYLIDLHRVHFSRKLSRRWQLKDIAALYFSAMDAGLSRQDIFRFIEVYTGMPWQDAVRKQRLFWRRVEKRAGRLYRKFQRHMDRQNRN